MLLGSLAAVAACAMASTAMAQTYCVGAPAGCVGVAQPTVAQAMIAATGTAERDLVRIGGGTFVEPSWPGGGQQIDIVGSGQAQTFIHPQAGALLQLPAGGTLSDLTIVADGAAGVGLQATGAVTRIRVTGSTAVDGVRLDDGASITNSSIELPTDLATIGITVLAGLDSQRIEDVTVKARDGISMSAPTTVHRATVTSGGIAIHARDTTATVTNVLVRMVNEPSVATARGLSAETGVGGNTAVLQGAHITVVGSGRPDESGVFAGGNGPGLSASVTLRDSIIFGVSRSAHRDATAASAGILITSSALDPTSALAEGTMGGVLDIFSPSNTSADPQFVGAGAGDFRLASTSPLRDAGSFTALSATESATDLAGTPRILNGSSTCNAPARRDMGAFEFIPGVSATAAVSPAQVDLGAPATFDATGSCDFAGLGAPAFSWTFDDGVTATGAQVTHAFTTPGTHTATLTVSRAGGTVSATATATVVAKDVTAPRMAILTSGARLSPTGNVRVRLRCPAAEFSGPCSGTLTLRTAAAVPVRVGGRTVKRVLTLGSVRFTIKAGGTRDLSVRVSTAGKALIRSRGSLRVRASAAARDTAGNRKTVTRTFTTRIP